MYKYSAYESTINSYIKIISVQKHHEFTRKNIYPDYVAQETQLCAVRYPQICRLSKREEEEEDFKPRRERLGLSGRGFKGGFCSFPIGCVRVVTYNRRYKYEHTQPECIMKESYDYGWNHTYDYGWNHTHD